MFMAQRFVIRDAIPRNVTEATVSTSGAKILTAVTGTTTSAAGLTSLGSGG